MADSKAQKAFDAVVRMTHEVKELRTRHMGELEVIVNSFAGETDNDELWDLAGEIHELGYAYGRNTDLNLATGHLDMWVSSSIRC
jgi:hypothetical protein